MDAHVIIATKGRPDETATLVRQLADQSKTPASVIVVGASPADIASVERNATSSSLRIEAFVNSTAGSSIQRNAGVEKIIELGLFDVTDANSFIAFFDDDFRPSQDWLAHAEKVFSSDETLLGLTGNVLADGVKTAGLSERDAAAFLAGERPPQKHWASGATQRELDAVYGCNMAFRGDVFDECRFDENLPLYAWQEDRDFTGQVRKRGKVVYTPQCTGVHLGVKRGRTSGVRFGYSQIANPLYLTQKGTMSGHRTRMFLLRAVASNSLQIARFSKEVDYAGRLKGNAMAIFDLARGRCRPQRILDF